MCVCLLQIYAVRLGIAMCMFWKGGIRWHLKNHQKRDVGGFPVSLQFRIHSLGLGFTKSSETTSCSFLLCLLLDLGHNDLEFSKEKHEDLLIGSTILSITSERFPFWWLILHHPHMGLIMRYLKYLKSNDLKHLSHRNHDITRGMMKNLPSRKHNYGKSTSLVNHRTSN